MCRMLGMVAAKPVALRALLRDAPRSLAFLSNAHRDGWGIAAARDGAWTVVKSVECAAESSGFLELAAAIVAPVVIAHVRQRTVGPTSLANTHPFRWGQFVFAHNGTVQNLPAITSLTSGERMRLVEGDTDSERLFAFLMSCIDDARSTHEGVVRAAATLSVIPNLGTTNFLLSDGATLHAFRRGRGMFLLERTGRQARDPRRTPAVIVASEPLTGEPWQELRDGALVHLSLGTCGVFVDTGCGELAA